jgi:hypothetical protein
MPQFITDPDSLAVTVAATDGDRPTVVWRWVSTITDLVADGQVRALDRSGPTVASRFYAMAGTAMYEAWQIFQRESGTALGAAGRNGETGGSDALDALARWLQGSLSGDRRDAVIENTISLTVARVLQDAVSGLTESGGDAVEQTRHDLWNDLPEPLVEAVHLLSSRVADRVIDAFADDGFEAVSDYRPANGGPGTVGEIDRWTPEFQRDSDPSSGLQRFLHPQWGDLGFYLLEDRQIDDLVASIQPPAPFLLDPNDRYDPSSGLLFDDGKGPGIPIDKDAIGTFVNPAFIEQAETVLDFSGQLTRDPEGATSKGIAEFWEDGTDTPFPPGTWMVFGQFASLDRGHSLADDVKLFLGLGASLFGASITAWDLKVSTDYVRPVRAIRELSQRGFLEDIDGDPSNGTQVAAYSRDLADVDVISGAAWETYQKDESEYSPPFGEYVSGHSAFSASAASFLASFLGSDLFGGSVAFDLTFAFEDGAPVQLVWPTWSAAAEEAGLSRLWGGIHFPDGNEQGLQLGEAVGATVYEQLAPLWG